MHTHGGLAAPITWGDGVSHLPGNILDRARDIGPRHTRNAGIVGLVPTDRRPAAANLLRQLFSGQAVLLAEPPQPLLGSSLSHHEAEL